MTSTARAPHDRADRNISVSVGMTVCCLHYHMQSGDITVWYLHCPKAITSHHCLSAISTHNCLSIITTIHCRSTITTIHSPSIITFPHLLQVFPVPQPSQLHRPSLPTMPRPRIPKMILPQRRNKMSVGL